MKSLKKFAPRDLVMVIMWCAAASWPAAGFCAPNASIVALPAPDPVSGISADEYTIGPLDELDVSVYQDKDLTQTVDVDVSGHIFFPLIGEVVAAGKSPKVLAQEISDTLGQKYLQDPHVSVAVRKSLSQKVIIEGNVSKPGVYNITGKTTLVQAIALASGVDQYADYHSVAVFRYANRERYSAYFDLDKINRGVTPDPEVYSNDIIVVERSKVKSDIRDYVAPLAPLIYLVPTLIPRL